MKYARNAAFTLVELAIVLVILGLLVGGVLASQSLIRSAQLRAVGKEYMDYITAVNSFKGKYLGIPGDLSNATAFWGKDNTNCSGDTGTAATPGTCNGNGDGVVPAWSGAEQFRFWQQLALAGLISGQYTGVAGPVNGTDAVIGVNVPASKFPATGWNVGNLGGFYGGDVHTFAMDYGSYFNIGAQWPGNSTFKPAMTATDAWNIDTKFDDGLPGRGRIIAEYYDVCTDTTNPYNYNANYLLSAKDNIVCSLTVAKAF